MAMSLSQSLASNSQEQPKLDVRMGINLGPVRLVRDSNGHVNIIGDGINVAERVMSFARPGQVLVSGSYHEVVTRVSENNAQLFAYQGSRTDMDVRDHEIYEVASTAGATLELSARAHHAPAAPRPALLQVE